MGPNRQPFEKSDGVSVPEATRLASGAAAAADASARPEGEDPGSPVTDAEPQPGSAEPGSAEAAPEVEHDLEQLEARAERADEYLELAQRTKADFENYRKRAA